MTAYLLTHPPRRSQYRRVRRAKPTGTVVLHSAENAPDLVLPDEGAERIARFIRDRTDPGSYHVIADQDSRIELVPFSAEAFGDGTGSNPWAIHLSLALRASDWSRLTNDQRLWYVASLATAARDASNWLRIHHNVSVPVRRLTKASATQPGFCSHQDREEWFGTRGRRTDPWGNDPTMWHLFLTLYEDTANRSITAEEPDMTPDQARKLDQAAADAKAARAVVEGVHNRVHRIEGTLGRILAAVPASNLDAAEVAALVLEGLDADALSDTHVSAIIDALPAAVKQALREGVGS